MSTMQAMVCRDGALEMQTVEKPIPGPTDVLINVSAAGVNPIDWKTRHGGGVHHLFEADCPMILGWDVAGTVEAIGAGVTRFEIGDRVFGMPRFPRPASAYAEYVIARSREIARTPDQLTDVEAGGLPLAGLTAWQSLIDTLRIAPGDRLLIQGASGGVGHLAVQIAKAHGAESWGTASAANHAALVELGLNHPIDYKTQRFEDHANHMDAVLILAGDDDTTSRSLSTLRRGGQLLIVPSTMTSPPLAAIDAAGVGVKRILVEPDYASLEQLAMLVTTGQMKVVIGAQRPLDDVAALHHIGETTGSFGKLVAVP